MYLQSATTSGYVFTHPHTLFRAARVLRDILRRKKCILVAVAAGFLLAPVGFRYYYVEPSHGEPLEPSPAQSNCTTPRTSEPSSAKPKSPTLYTREVNPVLRGFDKRNIPKQDISMTSSAVSRFVEEKSKKPHFVRATETKMDSVKIGAANFNSITRTSQEQSFAGVIPEKQTSRNSIFVTSTTAVYTTTSPRACVNHTPPKIPGWKVTSDCGHSLRVLYYVHTTPKHGERRRFLRKTIGSPEVAAFVNSSVVFFVGTTTDKNLQDKVHAEAEEEGDVVELDFLDTYRNLTLKFIEATKWLLANDCLNSTERVLVKLDDDVIVNVFLLTSYVEYLLALDPSVSPRIHCALLPLERPVRQNTSKWFVSKQEYAASKYPPFCAGAAFMMRASVLASLGRAASRVPFFWIDDVYATGLVARAAKVSLDDITRHYSINPSDDTVTVSKNTLFFHMGQRPVFLKKATQLWNSVMNQNITYDKGS